MTSAVNAFSPGIMSEQILEKLRSVSALYNHKKRALVASLTQDADNCLPTQSSTQPMHILHSMKLGNPKVLAPDRPPSNLRPGLLPTLACGTVRSIPRPRCVSAGVCSGSQTDTVITLNSSTHTEPSTKFLELAKLDSCVVVAKEPTNSVATQSEFPLFADSEILKRLDTLSVQIEELRGSVISNPPTAFLADRVSPAVYDSQEDDALLSFLIHEGSQKHTDLRRSARLGAGESQYLKRPRISLTN